MFSHTHTHTHTATVTRTLRRYHGNQNTWANYSYSCRLQDTNSYSGTLLWTNKLSMQAVYLWWAVSESTSLQSFVSMDIGCVFCTSAISNLTENGQHSFPHSLALCYWEIFLRLATPVSFSVNDQIILELNNQVSFAAVESKCVTHFLQYHHKTLFRQCLTYWKTEFVNIRWGILQISVCEETSVTRAGGYAAHNKLTEQATHGACNRLTDIWMTVHLLPNSQKCSLGCCNNNHSLLISVL